MKRFFSISALTVNFFFATAQLVNLDTINITNVKTDKYQYLPFTKCFFLMPEGFKNVFAWGNVFSTSSFRNDSGSYIYNLYVPGAGYNILYDTIPYKPIDSIMSFWGREKISVEYFKINGFNATLVDTHTSYENLYFMLIGNESFSAYVYACYKNQVDKSALKNTLLSVYPDTSFRKKYPREEFSKLKYFPENTTVESSPHNTFGDFYLYDIDTCLRMDACSKYYNMFVDFDDFVISFKHQIQSNYEYEKSIRNIKVTKGKKFNMLEYERADKYSSTGNTPPKTAIWYGAFIASNFKMLEVHALETGKCKNCNTPENYPKSKKKYKKFLKTIVLD